MSPTFWSTVTVALELQARSFGSTRDAITREVANIVQCFSTPNRSTELWDCLSSPKSITPLFRSLLHWISQPCISRLDFKGYCSASPTVLGDLFPFLHHAISSLRPFLILKVPLLVLSPVPTWALHFNLVIVVPLVASGPSWALTQLRVSWIPT